VVVLRRTCQKERRWKYTPMTDSHHSPCRKRMVAIMVHNIEEGKDSSEIFTIYQFCPACTWQSEFL